MAHTAVATADNSALSYPENDDTLDELLRREVKQWLAESGMKHTHFARRIGRTPVWVARYLGGQRDANLDTLEKIARIFGRDLGRALNGVLVPRRLGAGAVLSEELHQAVVDLVKVTLANRQLLPKTSGGPEARRLKTRKSVARPSK